MQHNWFDILGLELTYDIVEHNVRQQYYIRLAAVHPDNFTSAVAQQQGQRQSSLLNQAYHGILDPLQRAAHLLQVLYDIDYSQSQPSAELLASSMAWREESCPEVINDLRKQAIKDLSAAFSQGNAQQALALTLRLKFIPTL